MLRRRRRRRRWWWWWWTTDLLAVRMAELNTGVKIKLCVNLTT